MMMLMVESGYSCMPGFHHSVAVLPFRIATVDVSRENGNAGNVFPYTYRDEVTRER